MPVAEEPHAAREEVVGASAAGRSEGCCYTWCMSLVSPFVGLLFDGSIVGSHDLVTTPPYDVISDDERRHYLDASPYNVIRLVLGRTEPARAGRSTSIGRRRPSSRRGASGCARPDRAPVFYPYEMRFSLHGRRRAIRGWSARWSSRTWGGSIVPHEQTMPGPIEDRLRLMRAVRTNLSSIHAVFRARAKRSPRSWTTRWRGDPPSTTDEAGSSTRSG